MERNEVQEHAVIAIWFAGHARGIPFGNSLGMCAAREITIHPGTKLDKFHPKRAARMRAQAVHSVAFA